MVLSVDPARAGQGELADEERERLTELGKHFSREDLMRAFDLLAKAEQDIRNASQPRYHFEMVLLQWMHLRKLVPLTELMEQMGGAGRDAKPKSQERQIAQSRSSQPAEPSHRRKPRTAESRERRQSAGVAADQRVHRRLESEGCVSRGGSRRQGLLLQHRRGAGAAHRRDRRRDHVHLFADASRAAGAVQRDARVARVGGREGGWPADRVTAVQGEAPAAPARRSPSNQADTPAAGKRDLKAEAMSSSAVQAMLDVFPAEIRDVEEM